MPPFEFVRQMFSEKGWVTVQDHLIKALQWQYTNGSRVKVIVRVTPGLTELCVYTRSRYDEPMIEANAILDHYTGKWHVCCGSFENMGFPSLEDVRRLACYTF